MKKIALSAVLLLLVNWAIGQTTNAVLLYENPDGPELAKAKEQIDKAALNEKQNTTAKMWYYRGMIYMDLALSDKPELKELGKDGFKVAAESFEKVKQFDKKGEYTKLASEKAYPLWGSLINRGFTVKEENPTEAFKYYDLATKIYPDSATSYEYAIDLAYKKENYEKLKEYYSRIVNVSKKPEWYHNWVWVLQNIDKNNEKALEVVQKGRKEFPSSGQLMEDEVNLYIALNKIDEAQSKMEEAIKVDTKNPLLFFNLGTIYAKKGEEAKAIELYNKALALDPNSFETNFNLGAHYYNKAAEIINKTNKMSLQEYNKVGKKKDEEATGILKQSLPYLEKAYQVNSKDPDLKKILKDAYVRLKMNDKVKSLN